MNVRMSLKATVVYYVFLVMVFAGLLTSLLFALLFSMGALPFFLLTPILTPFVALIVSSAIGTFVSALASERVLKPLNQLVQATRVVSQGDFGVRVEEIDDDSEVANLLRGFNHMAEELGSIEILRDDFINNFSHEFKTPIVSIRGFAKQLQNETLSPEKRREYEDIIISESERLTHLSTDILLLTDYEHQQIVANRSEYELDEQIRNCVILLESQWSRKCLDMELDLEAARIFGNAEMLSHLWINLIDNAIKFSNENGRVSISCREEADDIRVAISDEGKGMDEVEQRHIFEKFYKGDRSHVAHGNGLGLSIVKRIIELCEGEIGVESGIGEGSTFAVRLPKRIDDGWR
jgi:signal transduction histidine kinase